MHLDKAFHFSKMHFLPENPFLGRGDKKRFNCSRPEKAYPPEAEGFCGRSLSSEESLAFVDGHGR